MYGFNKIVLSRKGFDANTGGGFSPFDTETGKYVLLPIPDGTIGDYIGNGTRYEQIEITPNYLPRIDALTLKALINSDALSFGKKVKEDITKKYAHFDPWLGPCPWLEEDSNHHIGAFGQVGAAQAHLCNQGVGKGSLFLFFSRFAPVGQDRENRIVPSIDREHLDKGLYFIYGWLKVKEVIQQYDDIHDPRLLLCHPHATKEYFNKVDPFVRKKNNTIYIADELLCSDDTIPGCGYFRKLSRNLLLTSEEYPDTPRIWRLPGFFYEKRPTVLRKGKWSKNEDGSCLVEIPKRWQEAVFEPEEGFYQWFKAKLLPEMHK